MRAPAGRRDSADEASGLRAGAVGPARARSKPNTEIAVRVWLFGALSALCSERPFVLKFSTGATARHVIEAIGERCGPAFLEQVLCTAGSLLRCCRVFANGIPVDDLDALLTADGSTVEVEMIVMMSYEGG